MNRLTVPVTIFAGVILLFPEAIWSAEPENPDADLPDVSRKIEQLQEQLSRQQQTIDALRQQVSDLETARRRQTGEIQALQNQAAADTAGSAETARAQALGSKLLLSGEGGVAYLDSQSGGQYPNSEFRVDEAKLFVDAEMLEDAYFFAELNLLLHEEGDEDLDLGELYVEIENVSRLWNRDDQLTVRVGRLDIPFGEEYIARDAIDNPMISHSLADFWGVDEGVEGFGKVGKLDYTLAVQNGGHPNLRDYNSDKAVVARVGVEPARWLRLSLSGMRTGNLDVQGDGVSELWFANGYIRSLGAPETTTVFHANLVEGDAIVRWSRGHLALAAGYLDYDDNDTAADNQRDVYFCSVEGLQSLSKKLYAAARFSQIKADDGFPLVGQGNWQEYFYEFLTEDLWRGSLDLGYRMHPNLLLKAEYSLEGGQTTTGESRNDQDQLSAEAAFRF